MKNILAVSEFALGLFFLCVSLKPDLIISRELKEKKETDLKIRKTYDSWRLQMRILFGIMAIGLLIFSTLHFMGIH